MNKNTPALTLEERILMAVRGTLIDVIRDTTTIPGSEHPLSKQTRDEIRHCLDLITARQVEIAKVAGRPLNERPLFVDKA
ncbi:MAG: segregation and condensation protein A, partial [Gammaproteobacteria bacterium]|nr:segregation and condensation protein A [Gammaproteobacteria bacterium]